LFQIVVRSRVETVFASSRYAGLSSGFHPATPRDTTRVGHPHDTLKKGAFVTRPCLALIFDAARLQCVINMA